MTTTENHQALYRRWRSQRFADVVGQEAVVATLRNGLRTGRTAHAYLFVGPRGTGKTSLARILAKALNCPNLVDGEPCDQCPTCEAIRRGTTLDLVEIDAASNRGIDAIRDLRERIHYPPGELRRKVYILDEAHQITRDGWNALLKTLEEPPDFVVFMFASTEPSGFPPAVLSRLQRFDLRPLSVPQIEGKLRRILAADGRPAEPEAVELVARLANGGMRDAESILDQLLSGDAPLTADGVRDLLGLADGVSVAAFITALAGGDAAGGIGVLDAVEDRGRDLRSFTDQVVDMLRTALRTAVTGSPDSVEPLPRLGLGALAAAARRLGAIDPSSSVPGGLRFQLELALLSPVIVSPGPLAATVAAAEAPAPAAALPATAPPLAAPVAPRPAPPPTPALAHAAEPHAHAAEPPAHAQAGGFSPAMAARPVPPPPPAPSQTAPPPAPTAPAPAPSSRAPAPASTAPGGADDGLAELRRRWPDIVALISRHPPTKPLIEACRPIAVDGATVTLGFPESQAFWRDVADRRRASLEEGLARILGRPVAVRCIATNLDTDGSVPADGEGASIVAIARNVFGSDLLDAPEVD